MAAFLSQAAEYGVALVLIGVFFLPLAWFFIKRDRDRETRMGARLDEREADARDARNAHIADLRSVVVNNTQAVQALNQTLGQRPCLLNERKNTDA